MFLGEQGVLVHFQVRVMELDVLASGVWNARLHPGVMLVSAQAPPNLERTCVLAKLLLQVDRDVVGGLAVFTEFRGALQPHSVANLATGTFS